MDGFHYGIALQLTDRIKGTEYLKAVALCCFRGTISAAVTLLETLQSNPLTTSRMAEFNNCPEREQRLKAFLVLSTSDLLLMC